MSDEIARTIESYIQQEQRLLNQLIQIRSEQDDFRTELGKEVVSLGAREILGRKGGKLVRKIMEKTERERIRNQEVQIDSQHRGYVQRIRGLLGTVSEWRKNLKEPNSDMLISRLERAQTGVRVATRIRATIKFLTSQKSKRFVYNKDIPIIEEKGVVLAPGSPFTGIIELAKVLGSVSEYVKICDPWVDIETLEALLSVPKGIPIYLLTDESGKSRRFQNACSAFQVERSLFEVRLVPGLHDRFILTKNRGWLLGSSIKDFGKKFSAFTPLLNKDAMETESIYDDLWRKAQPL